MTILAAVREGDDLLVASDSLVTKHDGTTGFSKKLWWIDRVPVVWGFSGADLSGMPIVRWLQQQPWPSLDWPRLESAAATKLAELNRAEPTAQAELLIVGYLASTPMILGLSDESPKSSIFRPETSDHADGANFVAMGSGVEYAIRTYGELTRSEMELGEGFLSKIMRIAIREPMCGGPIQAVRITPTGVVEIRFSDAKK